MRRGGVSPLPLINFFVCSQQLPFSSYPPPSPPFNPSQPPSECKREKKEKKKGTNHPTNRQPFLSSPEGGYLHIQGSTIGKS